MTMLVPVPIVNQRTQPGTDGHAPEDGPQDCVPASLSAMAAALLGTPQNADAWHDAVYGQGYIGLQDPARYVDHCAALGLTLTETNTTARENTLAAMAALQEHCPVLLAIPSDWLDNPPTSKSVHMVAGCDTDGATVMTCMNPWTAAYEHYTVEWWQTLLGACAYQGIWIMRKAGHVMANWTDASDATGPAMKDAHGVTLRYGQGQYVRQYPDTPNAQQGLPAQQYIGGNDAFTVLEDSSVIWYSKPANAVQRITGDLGRMVAALVAGTFTAPPPTGGDPTLIDLGAALVAFAKAHAA